MNWSAGARMPARNEEAVITPQENGAVATQPCVDPRLRCRSGRVAAESMKHDVRDFP